MKQTRVYIGLLSGNLSAHVSLVAMASDLPVMSASKDIPWQFVLDICAGHAPQEFARNTIIKRFLATKGDILLMVDDDMVWRGLTTLEILNTPWDEWDIVAPCQQMFHTYDGTTDPPRMPQIVHCAFNRDPNPPAETPHKTCKPVWPMHDQPVTQVDAVGSGVMAIKRRVLEDERMLLAPDMDPPAFFRNVYAANGVRHRGLDVDFCYRARELDYKVAINWKAHVGHYKRVDLSDIEIYAKLQFHQGYELGGKHALQVEEGEGGQENGTDRGSRGQLSRYPALG